MSRFDLFDKNIAEGTSNRAVKDALNASVGQSATFSNVYRYVVMDVVFDNQYVDDTKVSYWEHELGVTNIQLARVLPRNTIIATRVLEGSATDSENPMFLFPFFPPSLSLPVHPGEHVWVMFENESIKNTDIGYWMCRIVGPGFVEDANHTHMPRMYDPSFHTGTKEKFDGTNSPAYEFRIGAVTTERGVRRDVPQAATLSGTDPDVYEKLMVSSDAGNVVTYEPVPRFRKRPGDLVLEGRHNTLVALSQNRRGPAATYTTNDTGNAPGLPIEDAVDEGTGRIDVVVGRGLTPETLGTTVENSLERREVTKSSDAVSASEGDPDLDNDASRVMLSQRSRVDDEMGLAEFNEQWKLSDGDGVPNIVVKSNKVRIIGRQDVELLVGETAIIVRDDGNIVIKPGGGQVMVESEGDDAKLVALSNLVKDELQAIRDEFNDFVNKKYNKHFHPHPMGPTLTMGGDTGVGLHLATPNEMPAAKDVASKKLRTV